MNPRNELKTVTESFKAEAREIEGAFLSTALSPRVTRYTIGYAPHADGCVVSLWDAWNRFLRDSVVTCASGPTLGLSGSVYTPKTPRSEAGVLSHLTQVRRQYNLRLVQGEPSWYNLRQLPDITNCLGLQNSTQIYAAAASSNIILGESGSVSNPLGEIQIVRNFIAHKTAAQLDGVQRIIGGGSNDDVHRYLWTKTKGGIERFSLWVNAICSVADNVCN